MTRTGRAMLWVAALSLAATLGPGSIAAPNRVELSLDKNPAGELLLDWTDTCPKSGTDYGIYQGDLGSYTSHSSIQCSSAGGTSATLTPPSTSSYFLIVPLDDGSEGSYGVDSAASERPVGVSTCLPSQLALACAVETFVDAPAAQVARLDSLLASAATLLEAGGSYTDVANMLNAEPDVEGVSSNGVSLYFTAGGLPSSIYDTNAARHGGALREIILPSGARGTDPAMSTPDTQTDSSRALASAPTTADLTLATLPKGQRMPGDDDDGDGYRDMAKHALILSPWAFDFAPDDSAPMVQNILNGVRDYQEGSITYKSNTQDLLTDTLLLSDYIDGWDTQDIIFISTHGDADANAAWGPAPYLYLGIGGSTCADIAAKIRADVPDSAQRPGLYCSLTIEIGPGNNPITGRDTLGTQAFWETAHGGNLSKKLIYLDACRTAFDPGLAEAITGPDSVFFGWSEYVLTTTSTSAADAILRDSAEDGFSVLRSFTRNCAGGACMDPPGDTVAELLAGWDRADLRLRDSLEITSTPTPGFCGLSATLPVSQTCPSCAGISGLSIQFGFRFEGAEQSEIDTYVDPLDFGKYQLRLFADVDGETAGYAYPLTDTSTLPLGDGIYVDLLPVTLAMDNVCPNQTVTYRPWILLPAFDETMPGNPNRDRLFSWDGPFDVEIIPIILP